VAVMRSSAATGASTRLRPLPGSSSAGRRRLVPRAYDVYICVDGDNKVYSRSASYVVRVPGESPITIGLTDNASSIFNGQYVEAIGSSGKGDYVRVRLTGREFTITATPVDPATGTRRAPIDGVQIVPATTALPMAVDFAGNASTTTTAVHRHRT
jgi:hypothetical protein